MAVKSLQPQIKANQERYVGVSSLKVTVARAIEERTAVRAIEKKTAAIKV
ncbi:unnamed protein product, partial [Brassica oleracea var. botrytis]